MYFSLALLAAVAGLARADALTSPTVTTPTIDHRVFKRDIYVRIDEDAPAFEKRAASCTFPTCVIPEEDDDAFLTSAYSSPPKSSSLSAPISVTGTFDGGNVRFDRGSGACESGEGGDADAVFLVASGGTVQ